MTRPQNDVSSPRLAAERNGAWGSDLSAADLSALRSVGFEPAGLVLGVSVNMVGYQPTPYWASGRGSGLGLPKWKFSGHVQTFDCSHGKSTGATWHGYGRNWQLTTHEEAVDKAYASAFARLQRQAEQLGGHGVVGARTNVVWQSPPRGRRGANASRVVEFSMIGTAVRRPGAAPLQRPFTCHLSGVEFVKLLVAGWVPSTLAVGVGMVRSDGGCGSFRGLSAKANWDVPQYAAAIDRARAIAVRRLAAGANATGDGILGVSADINFGDVPGAESSKLASVLLVGTAVRRMPGRRPRQMPDLGLRLT